MTAPIRRGGVVMRGGAGRPLSNNDCCCDEVIDSVCAGKTYRFPPTFDVDYGAGFTGDNASPCFDCTAVFGVKTLPFQSAFASGGDLYVDYYLTEDYDCGGGTATAVYLLRFTVDCAESGDSIVLVSTSHLGIADVHRDVFPWSDYSYDYTGFAETLPTHSNARCDTMPSTVDVSP